MKRSRSILLFGILGLFVIIACSNIKADNTSKTVVEEASNTKAESNTLSEDFKKYWYNGTAEISSYQLEQARYGEIEKGQLFLSLLQKTSCLVNK